MIDVALITAPSPGPLSVMASQYAGVPPLGLAYLSARLRQEGFRVNLVDMNLGSASRRYLQRFLKVKRPRLVGISSLTESFPNAVRIARMAKQIGGKIPVVVGGPHVTFTAEETLLVGPFDFVVCGEGEETLAQLADHLLRRRGNIEQIAGLCWREGGQIRRTPPRALIEELDRVPFPDRRSLFLEEYPNAGALITGRGCPCGCIFCSAGAMYGGRYRTRSPEMVVQEVGLLRHMGLTSLMFVDDSLTVDLKRLDHILYLLRQRDGDVRWFCESRVDIEDPKFFRKMALAGCRGVQFGVESGSPEVLAALGKGIVLDQVAGAIDAAARAGIHPVCSLMIGLPRDTEDTVHQTIEFASALQREYHAQVGISIATPFPGTYMFRHAQELGLEIMERDYARYNLYTPVMRTRHLSRKQIRNLHFECLDRLRRGAPEGMGSLFPTPPGPDRGAVYDYREGLF